MSSGSRIYREAHPREKTLARVVVNHLAAVGTPQTVAEIATATGRPKLSVSNSIGSVVAHYRYLVRQVRKDVYVCAAADMPPIEELPQYTGALSKRVLQAVRDGYSTSERAAYVLGLEERVVRRLAGIWIERGVLSEVDGEWVVCGKKRRRGR